MESFFNLANHFAQGSLHGVASSALPNAPVQPYTAPRHRTRKLLAVVRSPLRRPVIGLQPVRYSAEC
jgi:hypothetical protein